MIFINIKHKFTKIKKVNYRVWFELTKSPLGMHLSIPEYHNNFGVTSTLNLVVFKSISNF